MVKFCRFDSSRRCIHPSSCAVFDCVFGNVFLCPLFRGGDMLTSRKISPVHDSLHGKHLKVDRLRR